MLGGFLSRGKLGRKFGKTEKRGGKEAEAERWWCRSGALFPPAECNEQKLRRWGGVENAQPPSTLGRCMRNGVSIPENPRCT